MTTVTRTEDTATDPRDIRMQKQMESTRPRKVMPMAHTWTPQMLQLPTNLAM